MPAHPTMVAVDLGDGPQVRELKSSDAAGPQTIRLKSRTTDTITLSLLNWNDVIDRTALGFDQLKPPGLAEVAVLGGDDRPVAGADANRNRSGRSPSTALTARSWQSRAVSCTPRSAPRRGRCSTANR
ncbi:putative transmembrane protein [Mycobacterium xenopi 4042]|uniref:Putative transmembrane protein n=1 Tax=Mycobacterium xenopi 4042 TaxID=1299334 RepID=X7Z9Y6_MYCXE|nr:putative transmembrane protein [Mycobacterium xenopi 4042]